MINISILNINNVRKIENIVEVHNTSTNHNFNIFFEFFMSNLRIQKTLKSEMIEDQQYNIIFENDKFVINIAGPGGNNIVGHFFAIPDCIDENRYFIGFYSQRFCMCNLVGMVVYFGNEIVAVNEIIQRNVICRKIFNFDHINGIIDKNIYLYHNNLFMYQHNRDMSILLLYFCVHFIGSK